MGNIKVFDNAPGVCERAVRTVHSLIEERVANGKSSPALRQSVAGLLYISPSLKDSVSGADLVIEIVPENVSCVARRERT